jgi:hypothetical protein
MVAYPSVVDRNRSNIDFGKYLGISIKTFVVAGQNMLKFLHLCSLSILKTEPCLNESSSRQNFPRNLYCISF